MSVRLDGLAHDVDTPADLRKWPAWLEAQEMSLATWNWHEPARRNLHLTCHRNANAAKQIDADPLRWAGQKDAACLDAPFHTSLAGRPLRDGLIDGMARSVNRAIGVGADADWQELSH